MLFDCDVESDVSSDAGSDPFVGDEFDYDEDCCCNELNDRNPPQTPTSSERQLFHGFIETETLRVELPPVHDDVMPALEPLITAERIAESAPKMVPSDEACEKRFRHNPYQFCVLPCRTTMSSPGAAPCTNFDKLPSCPCHLSALMSATLESRQPLIDEPQPAVLCSNGVPSAADASAPTPTPKRAMCCYFKQKGYCKMGASCWYSHEGDLYTPCHYGSSCKAGHATLAQMQEMQIGVIGAPSFRQSADVLVSMTGVTIRVGAAPLPRFYSYQ